MGGGESHLKAWRGSTSSGRFYEQYEHNGCKEESYFCYRQNELLRLLSLCFHLPFVFYINISPSTQNTVNHYYLHNYEDIKVVRPE